jgi:N6-L-threonylcarbamoyladenine synthase
MIEKNNFDWSFSGLKTAVARQTSSNEKRISKEKLAAEIQEAIVDVLVKKSLRAVNKFKPKSFLLAGGVAANKRLRERFQLEIKNIDFRVPSPKLCTDNAAYIACFAHYNHSLVPWPKITVNPQLTITGQA